MAIELYRVNILGHLLQPKDRTDVYWFQDHMSELFGANARYEKTYNFLQFLLTSKYVDLSSKAEIAVILDQELAAFTVVNGDTLVPYSNEGQMAVLKSALSDTSNSGYRPVNLHLRAAIDHINKGAWAASVRESITALESLSQIIKPSAGFTSTMQQLYQDGKLHRSLHSALKDLWAYTNDEQGIRHALREGSDVNVSEPQALLMLGLCSTFISYFANDAK